MRMVALGVACVLTTVNGLVGAYRLALRSSRPLMVPLLTGMGTRDGRARPTWRPPSMAELVRRKGAAVLLGWVKTGLP
jgi:hypothetical protein